MLESKMDHQEIFFQDGQFGKNLENSACLPACLPGCLSDRFGVVQTGSTEKKFGVRG
jgi:hypothetical protein